MFENIRRDLITYKGDISAQGFWVMVVYRLGRWRYGIKKRIFRLPFSLAYKILFKMVQIITGIELPCEVRLGKNFEINHFGGIHISRYVVFGDNCRIWQGVTVGLKDFEKYEVPEIGNDVCIGAGAKVLGPIKIGDHVFIGANSVVITDVPSYSIAVGVPARIISGK